MTWLEKRVISVLGVVLALLAAVLLVVLGLRYQATRARQEEEKALAAIADAKEEETVLETSPYSALTYINETATLSFSIRDDGTWVWSDDTAFPLDTSILSSILEELTSWDPIATVTDPAAVAAAAMDKPLAILTATMDEGAIRLTFGAAAEKGRYVAVNDDMTTLYVIDDTLYQNLCVPIYDMCLLPELPVLTEEAIHNIIVQGSPDEEGGGVTTFLLAQPDGKSVSWRTGGKDVTKDETVRALLADLAALKLEKCIIYRPSDAAAEMCGFDTPARLTVSYLYEDEDGDEAENALIVTIGNRVLDGSGRYVRINDDPSIYLLPTALLDPLMRLSVSGLAS